ncbi:papain-like cysteine protease family protein [Roseofilum capinflatum]|uniref:Papain-like cysteine protease family protein n=1 Tax=Roseofilum capinflatum BLCC-M114 TaxID=3022440 RepID=A0ABT7BE23_9CYAN|nr:papain-like cysteine protease family protein [Roseofilum capinflatum]MDJ1176839.1 papain-like cysteine protease family protein [Roseofilum capinflatum BLCC-M114]
MHPAWAGAGGNWPAIDEVVDARVVRQESEFSCAAACAQMLLRERGIDVTQAIIEQVTGVPIAPGMLASALNQFDPDPSGQWKGGFLDLPGATEWQVVEILNNTGLWAAVFWEIGARIGHMVIVEGLARSGYILILDPWEGTRYRMKKEDFLQYWNLTGVYWSLG